MANRDFRKPVDSIDDMDDESLRQAATEHFWPNSGSEDELSYMAEGTPGQRAVFATTIFAWEVDNGGFWQFFHNSSGIYWQHVVDGLGLLGANDHFAAFVTALDAFPGAEPPLDWEERRAIMSEMHDEYKDGVRAAENQIYRLGGFETTLFPYWITYIRSHPEEFFVLSS